MTRHEKIAYAKQSVAASIGRATDIFEQDKNVFIESGDDDGFFDLIHFGSNAVIIADKAILGWCIENFNNVPGDEIMKGNHFRALEAKLREHGKEICDDYKDISFMRLEEDANSLAIKDHPDYDFEIYEKDRLAELDELYKQEILPHALDEGHKEVLAIAARKDGRIIAIASCSAGYEGAFWCINVDTLANHRGKGLATYLVAKIVTEIENRGHVPLYTTWETNVASMHVASATGFTPVWLWCFTDDIQ